MLKKLKNWETKIKTKSPKQKGIKTKIKSKPIQQKNSIKSNISYPNLEKWKKSIGIATGKSSVLNFKF